MRRHRGEVRIVRQDVSHQVEEYAATVIAALTRNPALALGLQRKGRVAAGADADILLLAPDTYALTEVFCRGRRLLNQ